MTLFRKMCAALLVVAVASVGLQAFVGAPSASAWVNSCYNAQVVQRDPVWMGVSWFGVQDSTLNSNFATTTDSLTWRYFAANGSYGSEFQVQLDNEGFQRIPYPCGVLSYSQLSEGKHTLRIEQNLGVEFGWCASWVWLNCTTRTFYVDTTPPPMFEVVSPTANKVVSSTPQFVWNTTVDETSGTESYALFVDDVLTVNVGTSSCGAVCSFTPSVRLTDGPHSFYVVATDGVGLTQTTPLETFTVGDTPSARLTHSPQDGLTAQAITFDASGSSIPNGGVLTYEWDLDEDGVFETSTGTSSQTTVTYATRGNKAVSVRVVSLGGLTSIAATSIEIYEAPQDGEVGVTINGGDNSTSSKIVALNLVWPKYATKVRISNDGGFIPELTSTFEVSTPIMWKLDDSAEGDYTKIVYVRFVGKGIDPKQMFSDDILLLSSPPVVITTAVETPSKNNLVAAPTSGSSLAKSSGVGVLAKSSTLSLRVTRSVSEVARIARFAVPVATKLSMTVKQSSRKNCMMVGAAVIGLKKGSCLISLSFAPAKGKRTTKNITLRVG